MRRIIALALLCLVLAGCSEPYTGWKQQGDQTVYLNNGAALTGWLELEGKTYYLDESGAPLDGWLEVDGETYYFPEPGTLLTGWQEIGDSLHYFRETGTQVTGWLSMEGSRYYLQDTGAARGVCQVDGRTYLFNDRGALSSGWVTVEDKRYYGTAACIPLTGWQEIDGICYCFGADGAQQTGWLERDGFRYYFHPDGAAAQGRQTIDGQSYTFAFNGQQTLLVNPWNRLPADYEVELTEAENAHQVAAWAYDDFAAMMEACRAAGLRPTVCSGYRSQAYQQKLYDNRIQRWMAAGYSVEEATEKAGHSVAIPGTSEHQLGLALDIIDAGNWHLDESQAKTATQQWLMEHSWEYGWILRYPEGTSDVTGIIYEPWHYRYVGRAVAQDIHDSGLCLEEYLLSMTQTVG